MLYVTTREKFDAYTAPRTLASDFGPDGGAYVPYRMPQFSRDQLAKLKEQSFGQTVAWILNQFFTCRLTAWDVDSCIGKNPVKVVSVGNNILCAQLWQNLDGSYDKLERVLAAKVCETDDHHVKLTSWLRISIRIAVLFGVFAQIQPQEDVNLSVSADSFLVPMAAWYCRKMGLPIGRIICSCQATSAVWELIHLGQIKLDGDPSLHREVERLVFATLGLEDAKRFAAVANKKGQYKLLETEGAKLSAGMFAAVVGPERAESVVPSVYRTNQYLLASDSAICYAALMDYRAKTGSNRCALLLEDIAPAKQ